MAWRRDVARYGGDRNVAVGLVAGVLCRRLAVQRVADAADLSRRNQLPHQQPGVAMLQGRSGAIAGVLVHRLQFPGTPARSELADGGEPGQYLWLPGRDPDGDRVRHLGQSQSAVPLDAVTVYRPPTGKRTTFGIFKRRPAIRGAPSC